MSTTNLSIEINRQTLADTRVVEQPLSELLPGEVRFRVERFAVTANTVTYAVTGHQLGYWDFFPAARSGWGRVPAMGWGQIVESRHPDIPTGGRCYGWYPMSRYVNVQAVSTIDGLRDDAVHRASHAPVYRAFVQTDRDPFYQPGTDAEDRHALLRGLFVTGFLAEDFLADNDYFGARRAVLLSASSKTAIGFAHSARARGGIEVIGVTSAANLPFVCSLGLYDRVVGYGEIEALAADAPAVSVDMSGNGDVLARVHAHFGNRLTHSMAIGRSHHGAPPRAKGLAGPTPAFFFAPTQVKKRVQDWGRLGYQERLASALHGFVDASRAWLSVEHAEGAAGAVATWQDLYGNRLPPSVGRIVSL